jgi:heterodisulfide reductase subunit C
MPRSDLRLMRRARQRQAGARLSHAPRRRPGERARRRNRGRADGQHAGDQGPDRHWKKIQRVTPWLINKEPIPEREYIVPRESMIDVTQSMACIQCGACVSDCLSMEVDPLFTGPAALAKAYRFVGDPRDAKTGQRLKDLAEDEHGMYTCTHCFKCVEACPKGVAPMNQIMRLRRIAGNDYGIEDRNNGYRHEHAFVKNIERNGLLHEADLLPDSYGGKFNPRAVPELVSSLPAITKALARRKVTPAKALLHQHKAPEGVKKIYETVEARPERVELNLYITGRDEDLEEGTAAPPADHATPAPAGPGAATTREGVAAPDPTPQEAVATEEPPSSPEPAAQEDAAPQHGATTDEPGTAEDQG